jgi:heme exporter protein D
MSGLSDYFAMGGHAAYVWSAYGLAVLVLAGLLVSTLRTLRAWEARLRLLEADAPHRGAGGRTGSGT